jgi:hypothetical protein
MALPVGFAKSTVIKLLLAAGPGPFLSGNGKEDVGDRSEDATLADVLEGSNDGTLDILKAVVRAAMYGKDIANAVDGMAAEISARRDSIFCGREHELRRAAFARFGALNRKGHEPPVSMAVGQSDRHYDRRCRTIIRNRQAG